jgi:transglutaminase/protease-like cytokinesis protein 3
MNPSLGDGMPLNPNSFNYNPNYFMMPPELFILNHFPKEKGWQLLESPMSREQWINYPNFGPSMFADQSNRFFGPVVSQYIVNQRYRINLIYSGDIMWQVGQQSPKVTKLQPRGPAYYDEDVVAGSTDCYLTTVDYARHQSLLLTTPYAKYAYYMSSRLIAHICNA